MGGMNVLMEAIYQATGGSWIGQGLIWLVILAISMSIPAYLSQRRRPGKDK